MNKDSYFIGMERTTLVEVYTSKHGYSHIIVSPSICPSSYVVTIDPSGSPMYSGIQMIDIFPEHSLAAMFIREGYGSELIYRSKGLIGLARNENQTVLCLLDSYDVTGTLPGGHILRTIRQAKFLYIPSGKNISNYEQFQLVDNHFFCESYDMTRPFPSNKKPYDPDPQFVWNNGWIKPFVSLGIPQCCIMLIQGVGTSSSFNMNQYSISYIVRRSSLNPGTRYFARGLNDLSSPGNEVECELVYYTNGKFTSTKWRRGSVPIRWKTTLSSKLGSPQHKVDADYFNGTTNYFNSLKDRFCFDRIYCISLLQSDEDHSENEILEYFKKAISRLHDEDIHFAFYIPFDLNKFLHDDGSNETMKDFVSCVAPLTVLNGFTSGTLDGDFDVKQSEMCRFNCADSLDRTNLASFYYALLMTSEWCKHNGIGLSDPTSIIPNKIINQDIVDFLAKSFVESGNVVSQLYTNTPAIKINAIKKFSPSLPVSSSDTAITMQRRLQNVMNDPVRQGIIESWVYPPALSWNHRIDPYHLFLVNPPLTISKSLFGLRNMAFSLSNDQNNILIQLPYPMQLSALVFLLLPSSTKQIPNSVFVRVGNSIDSLEDLNEFIFPRVEVQTWSRYRISSERWGIPNKSSSICRFISLCFKCDSEVFYIGNIKIEAKSPFGQDLFRVKDADSPSQDMLNRFQLSLEKYLASQQNFQNAIELETNRIHLGISETLRNEICVEKGINPWVIDSSTRIFGYQPGTCAFCSQQIDEGFEFVQSQLYPGLLVPKTTETNSKSVFSCTKCIEYANLFASQAQICEEKNKIPLSSPKFEILSSETELYNRLPIISQGAQCALVKCSNGSELFEDVLRNSAQDFTMNGNDDITFTLSFAKTAFLMFIFSDSDNEFDILINEEMIPHSIYQDHRLIHTLPSSIEGKTLTFKLRANAPTVIHSIKLHGKLMDLPEDVSSYDISKFPSISCQLPQISEQKFDPSKRVGEISFKTRSINEIIFEPKPEPGFTSPLSIVLLFQNPENVLQKHFLLPEVSSGTKIHYSLPHSVTASALKIFYLDRVAQIKPIQIRLM